jgi:RNA polymerase sigma-70 factor, ECF subfamily
MQKRTNEEWITDLRLGGNRQAQALNDLRSFLVQRLQPVLLEKTGSASPTSNLQIDAIIEKTLAVILEDLDSFVERSALTTWALKIGVRQLLYELRWNRWQHASGGEGLPQIAPIMYEKLERDEFMQYIHRIFQEELTENQRVAIRAMTMSRVPKEVVARTLDMERCDYFKMIHDARLRLKHRLECDGWLSKE